MDAHLITRWLAAESAGREAAAEEALARLFSALPLPAAPAGLADRVLIGAGLAIAWQARVAIAAALLCCGLAAAFLPPVAIRVLQVLSPGVGEVLAATAQGAVAVLGRLDELLVVGRFVTTLVQSLWLVVTSPPVAVTLLLMTAIAVLAMRWLSELLNLQGNSGYVQVPA